MREPEEDNTRVRKAFTKNKLAKVAVIGYQDPLFPIGDSQHFAIRERGCVIMSYRSNIVSISKQVKCNSIFGALVQQEFHSGERTSFFFSISTSTCAYSRHAFTSSRVKRG